VAYASITSATPLDPEYLNTQTSLPTIPLPVRQPNPDQQESADALVCVTGPHCWVYASVRLVWPGAGGANSACKPAASVTTLVRGEGAAVAPTDAELCAVVDSRADGVIDAVCEAADDTDELDVGVDVGDAAADSDGVAVGDAVDDGDAPRVSDGVGVGGRDAVDDTEGLVVGRWLHTLLNCWVVAGEGVMVALGAVQPGGAANDTAVTSRLSPWNASWAVVVDQANTSADSRDRSIGTSSESPVLTKRCTWNVTSPDVLSTSAGDENETDWIASAAGGT